MWVPGTPSTPVSCGSGLALDLAGERGTIDKVCCRNADRPAGREADVSEEDIHHAVRNAMRRIDLDEDLTILIGPAADGRALEIGILDLEGEDPVVIHAMELSPKFYVFL